MFYMPNERRSGKPGRMEEVCDQYWGDGTASEYVVGGAVMDAS